MYAAKVQMHKSILILQVLIHIADCPCHGTQYHDLNGEDDHPDGDINGLEHESLLREISRMDLQYWFGYINKGITDKMIDIFSECLSGLSEEKLIIRQFNAIQAGEVGDEIIK